MFTSIVNLIRPPKIWRKDAQEMKKLLFIALMVPCLASASNWVLIGKNNSGATYFIDTQSIQRSGDSVTFWEKTNLLSRTPTGELSSKVSLTINCRTRELISRYFMFYDDINNQGKLTSSFAVPPSEKWEPISPDSVAEAEMKFVCKR